MKDVAGEESGESGSVIALGHGGRPWIGPTILMDTSCIRVLSSEIVYRVEII